MRLANLAISAAIAALLASCNSAPETPAGPQPGDDLLMVLVTKEDAGRCEAYFNAYADPSTGLGRVNTDLIWSNGSMGGSGLGMIDRDGDGILDVSDDFNSQVFDGQSCADVTLIMRPTRCEDVDGNDMECPPIRIEGTQALGSFQQRDF